MAQSITKKVSVNGWLNLGTQAKADGYKGHPILRGGVILNFNSTAAYLHLANDGSSAYSGSATGSDGLPIGTDTSTAPSPAFSLPSGADMNLIWIYTSGAQDIKYAIDGT